MKHGKAGSPVAWPAFFMADRLGASMLANLRGLRFRRRYRAGGHQISRLGCRLDQQPVNLDARIHELTAIPAHQPRALSEDPAFQDVIAVLAPLDQPQVLAAFHQAFPAVVE